MNKQSETNLERRLSISFHRSFSLNRNAIRDVLELAMNNETTGPIKNSEILDQTNLGTVYTQAMPRYAYAAGLIDINRVPTAFGKAVFAYDPILSQPVTQWLLHYFLSSPFGHGPIFWNTVVNKFFIPGEEFSAKEVTSFIAKDNKDLKEDTISDAKTIFIGTYLKSDGLGNLGLISEIENSKRYQVNFPEPCSVWAMAVAFFDYSTTCFPGLQVINLDEIIDNSDFSRTFMVGTRRINRMLNALQEEGYISLYMTAPPYQIALHRTDIVPLLEKAYASIDFD